MCNFMRTLNLIVLLSFNIACFSQITIDKTLERKYNSLLKKADKEFQKKAAQMETFEDYTGSYVIYTQFQTDTLNKVNKKIKKTNEIVVTDISSSSININKTELPFADIDFCAANFLNADTLKIEIGYPFNSKSIFHYIYRNSVKTNINIYYKHDSILKLKLTDQSFSNEINLGTTKISFTLSDTTFTINKYIFGFAEIITQDFYTIDNYSDNKIWHLRYRMKYYFKIRRTKNST